MILKICFFSDKCYMDKRLIVNIYVAYIQNFKKLMKACTQIPYEFSTMYEFKIVIVS